MSGHSKWSTIKHKKAIMDAKRANIFTKLGNMISVAAREGGGDLDTNFKLKMTIDKARSANMPKNNIERAIKRGTGKLNDGVEIQEIFYEAYGPGQIAMLIKTATDNTNRTVGDVKSVLTKTGGKMVSKGSVSFMFKKVGKIEVEIKDKNAEELELQAIEAGADDIKIEDKKMLLYAKFNELQIVKEKLEKENVQIQNAEIIFLPMQTVAPTDSEKEKYQALLEKLDQNDDIVEVYDNIG